LQISLDSPTYCYPKQHSFTLPHRAVSRRINYPLWRGISGW